jgi:hypothetical protein
MYPDIKYDGDKIVITIDVSEAAREKAELSRSGKSRLIASTHGFARYRDVAISLNASVPA